MYRIKKLAELVEGWRRVSQVRAAVAELTKRVTTGKEPFLGQPLSDELVHGRLPPGIESAWVFVLKPQTLCPPHKHPNSVQHMAVIEGGGRYIIGAKADFLQPFDPAFPERSIYVIPEGVSLAFEPGHEPLVVLSFHTVPADQLVKVEVASEKKRTHTGREGAGREKGKRVSRAPHGKRNGRRPRKG